MCDNTPGSDEFVVFGVLVRNYNQDTDEEDSEEESEEEDSDEEEDDEEENEYKAMGHSCEFHNLHRLDNSVSL